VPAQQHARNSTYFKLIHLFCIKNNHILQTLLYLEKTIRYTEGLVMASMDAYQKNIFKYQVYIVVIAVAYIGPLCNLFYLSANISFSQLSLIETTSMLVLIFLEVPTGALADLIGRINSMALGCCLMGVEFILIGAGYDFDFFILAALIGGVGICLESGNITALLYDSLKKLAKEHEFKKYIGQSRAIAQISSALSGIAAGYVYSIDKTYIFYISGILLIGLALFCLTMTETISRAKKLTISKIAIKKSNGINRPSTENPLQPTPTAKPLYLLIWRQCLKSYICLTANKPLAWTIIISCLLTSTARANSTLLRTPIMEGLLDDISHLGFIMAIGLGISSIVSWYAHQVINKINEQYIFIIYTLGIALVFIGVGLSDDLWIIAFMIAMYILNTVQSIFFSDYCHRQFHSRQRVTLSSFVESYRSFISIFTLLGTGILADTYGLHVSSLQIGFVVLAACIIYMCIKVIQKTKRLLLNHDGLTLPTHITELKPR